MLHIVSGKLTALTECIYELLVRTGIWKDRMAIRIMICLGDYYLFMVAPIKKDLFMESHTMNDKSHLIMML